MKPGEEVYRLHVEIDSQLYKEIRHNIPPGMKSIVVRALLKEYVRAFKEDNRILVACCCDSPKIKLSVKI
jgi:hypothetical protein